MAYQLNEPDTAIKILEKLKNLPGTTRNLSGSSKDGSRQYQYDYRKSVGGIVIVFTN